MSAHRLRLSAFRGPTAEFLQSVGADRLEHGRGYLLDHLLNTKRVLSAWSEPLWIQEAGALHSAYSTDVYRRQLLGLHERERLRAVVGDRAEHLVYLGSVEFQVGWRA
jgi:hypothetical protein